ncbi:MAG: M23 family metallopeptidase [Clostridia bacterium]|nr:M23 family metallopeptidase [Clostridia bacterium]
MFRDYIQRLLEKSKKLPAFINSTAKTIGRKRFFVTTFAMLITLAMLLGFWNHFILPRQGAMKPEAPVENPINAEKSEISHGGHFRGGGTSDGEGSGQVRSTGTGIEEREETEGSKDKEPASPDLADMKKPLEGEILRAFGFTYSPTFNDYRYHRGIDIAAPKGAEVRSVLDGRVEDAAINQREAYRIVIDHGGGWRTSYCHLGTAEVEKGDWVKAGTFIGRVGTPGQDETALGFHLHFEITDEGRPIDPQEYLSY